MGTEQPTQQAPWGAGEEGVFARFTEDGCCRAVSHTQLDATPRGSDVAPRQGVTVAAPVQTGSHRTRPAFVREGFQRRRAPESHSPLPSPGPASVPCLPPPGARPLSLVSPAARRGRRNRGPGCSLGARSVRARQSRDKAPCSASHPHSSQPRWTPSLRLWGSPTPALLSLRRASSAFTAPPCPPPQPGLCVLRPWCGASLWLLRPRSSLGVSLVLVTLSITFDQTSPPASNAVRAFSLHQAESQMK